MNQENPNIGTTTEDRAGRGVQDHAERKPGDRNPPLQRQVRVEERDRYQWLDQESEVLPA